MISAISGKEGKFRVSWGDFGYVGEVSKLSDCLGEWKFRVSWGDFGEGREVSKLSVSKLSVSFGEVVQLTVCFGEILRSYMLVYWLKSGSKNYVGSTKNLSKRIRQHNRELKGGAKCTAGCQWYLYRRVGSSHAQGQPES